MNGTQPVQIQVHTIPIHANLLTSVRKLQSLYGLFSAHSDYIYLSPQNVTLDEYTGFQFIITDVIRK